MSRGPFLIALRREWGAAVNGCHGLLLHRCTLVLRQCTTTHIVEHRPRCIDQPDTNTSTVCDIGPAAIHRNISDRRPILVYGHGAIRLGAGAELVACRQGEGNVCAMLRPAAVVMACPDLGRTSTGLVPHLQQITGRRVLRFEQQIDLTGVCINLRKGRKNLLIGAKARIPKQWLRIATNIVERVPINTIILGATQPVGTHWPIGTIEVVKDRGNEDLRTAPCVPTSTQVRTAQAAGGPRAAGLAGDRAAGAQRGRRVPHSHAPQPHTAHRDYRPAAWLHWVEHRNVARPAPYAHPRVRLVHWLMASQNVVRQFQGRP